MTAPFSFMSGNRIILILRRIERFQKAKVLIKTHHQDDTEVAQVNTVDVTGLFAAKLYSPCLYRFNEIALLNL